MIASIDSYAGRNRNLSSDVSKLTANNLNESIWQSVLSFWPKFVVHKTMQNDNYWNKYVLSVVSICLILSIKGVDDRPRPLNCPHFDFERIWELPTPSWRMPRLLNSEQERYSKIAHRRTRKFIKVVRNHYLISQLLKSFAFSANEKFMASWQSCSPKWWSSEWLILIWRKNIKRHLKCWARSPNPYPF